MSLESNLKCSFFFLLYVAFNLSFNTALPVTSMDDPLDKFIQFLSYNNCSMPKEVELPFSQTDPSPFSYLSIPLGECKSSEAFKANNKANLLCKETFDALQNITCTEYNVPLPKINSSHLSDDVCKDFAAIQNIIPAQEEYLSRKFSDNVICKVLCSEKYELLCKTLLWSYDTQAKIKNALTEDNGQGNANNLPLDNGASIEQGFPTQPGTDEESHPEMNDITGKETVPLNQENTKKPLEGSNLNNSIPVQSTTKNVSDQPIKNNSSVVTLDAKNTKLNNASQEAKTMGTDGDITRSKDNKVLPKKEQNQDNLPAEQNLKDKNTDHRENSIENLSKDIKNENSPDATQNKNVKTSNQENKSNQNKKPNASHTLPGEENNDNTNNNLNIKIGDKPDIPINPKPEENDLGNADYQVQENETETQKKPVELADDKTETLKGDLTPDITISKQESGLLDSTIFPDKSEEIEQRPEVKDPEQYNDSENDGDYAKQEYDNGFGTLKKNSDVKHSSYDGSSRISASSNIQISPDDFTGRQPEISRNYLPGRNYLPEQEDSHFFFYFLSIVLILMAGYLIFHNKQKIIALIVEGRHERRRRSHGAGYKKLETK